MKIWCLFSIDNNYDQPANNLVAWWPGKPSLDQLTPALGLGTWGRPDMPDVQVVTIVSIWTEKPGFRIGDTNYRLEQVKEGIVDA